jgi:hypothetical protein
MLVIAAVAFLFICFLVIAEDRGLNSIQNNVIRRTPKNVSASPGLALRPLPHIITPHSRSSKSLLSISPNLFMESLAGTSFPGFGGDNGRAASAVVSVAIPWVDNTGSMYLPDPDSARIRKIDFNTGIIITFAGTGAMSQDGLSISAQHAAFYRPYSIVGDAAGNVLYFSDQFYVWKYDSATDIAEVFANSNVNGRSGYNGDNKPATNAFLDTPSGLWLTTSDVLYIADSYNCRIRKVVHGIITTVAGNGDCDISGDGGPATNATLQIPRGVYVDTNGQLFVADTDNNRIRVVSSNNIITTIAGGGHIFTNSDFPANSSMLNLPYDVKGDLAGNIYIAEYLSCAVLVVNTGSGIMSTLFGDRNLCGYTPGSITDRGSLITLLLVFGLILCRLFISVTETLFIAGW